MGESQHRNKQQLVSGNNPSPSPVGRPRVLGPGYAGVAPGWVLGRAIYIFHQQRRTTPRLHVDVEVATLDPRRVRLVRGRLLRAGAGAERKSSGAARMC